MIQELAMGPSTVARDLFIWVTDACWLGGEILQTGKKSGVREIKKKLSKEILSPISLWCNEMHDVILYTID